MNEMAGGAPQPQPEEQEVNLKEVFSLIHQTFASDMEALKTSHTFDSADDWQAVFTEVVAAKNNLVARCPKNFKQSVETAYGLVKAVILQEMFHETRAELAGDRSDEAHKKLSNYSLHAARWQTACLHMVKQFEQFDDGEGLIGQVWQNLSDFSMKRAAFKGRDERLAARESRALRNGILSLRLVDDVLEYVIRGTDAEIVVPTPEEDVKEKTDLKAVRGSRKCAIQIKSFSNGLGDMVCERIDSFKSSHELKGENKQKVLNQNELYNKVRNQHIADEAIWVEVLGRSDKEVNHVTGRPSQVYLDRQDQGETGQNVRMALGIEQEAA